MWRLWRGIRCIIKGITFSSTGVDHLQSIEFQDSSDIPVGLSVFISISSFVLCKSLQRVFVMQENIWNDKGAAWPVANPVFTCASVTDRSNPSNFVADPFLYIQARTNSISCSPSVA